MSSNSYIYRLIDRTTDPSVDRAMAEALPTADDDTAAAIARRLLERRRPEALAPLVRAYHRMPEAIQQQIGAETPLLARALRTVARDRDVTAARNLVAIIGRSRDLSLAYLLAELLRRADADGRQAAGACLVELARETAIDPPAADAGRTDPAGIALLAEAIEASLEVDRGDLPPVIETLAWMLPRPCGRIMGRLNRPGHPAAAVLKHHLQQARPSSPHIARLVLPMLRWPNLGDMAAKAITRGGSGMVEALLPMAFLLLDPVARAALARNVTATVCRPDATRIGSLDCARARGLVRWIATAPLDRQTQLDELDRLRQAPDPLVRLTALRGLLGQLSTSPGVGPAPLERIARFAEDADPRVATLAAHHLARRGGEGIETILSRLVSSPHERVRSLAAARLVPRGIENLWQRWPRLDRHRRNACIRALSKLPFDPRPILERRLHSPDPQKRWRAIEWLRAAEMASGFQRRLIRLAAGRDMKVASAAIAALAGVGSHTAIAALEVALKHPDARVRSNAVEGLAKLRAVRHTDRLLKMADDDANRPRASAIAALLDLGRVEAIPALVRMLGDRRPEHRRSALWVTDQLGLVDVARHVAELAVSDSDETVRQRAAEVVSRLIDTLKTPEGTGETPPRANAS